MQKPFKHFETWLAATVIAGAVALFTLNHHRESLDNINYNKDSKDSSITEAQPETRRGERITTEPFSETQNPQSHEIYKGPKELTDFLANHNFSASRPDAFLATAGTQFRELFDLNRCVWEWAKENGCGVNVTKTEANIQEKSSWPMGYLELELGAGVFYKTRIMNSQLETEIETPRVLLKYKYDSRNHKKADFYQGEMIDILRKNALAKGEQFPDKLYALSFVFDYPDDPDSTWLSPACYGGYWSPDPRIKETEAQMPTYTQIQREGYGVTNSEFSAMQNSAQENTNLFKSQFPKTTEHIKK